jgi:hypothetical protein
MPFTRGQKVEVVRDARAGDYGFEKSLDQVVVRFPDTSEATVLRSEVDFSDAPDATGPVASSQRGARTAAVIHSALTAEDERLKREAGEDTRDDKVKRDEVDAERESRQAAGPPAPEKVTNPR